MDEGDIVGDSLGTEDGTPDSKTLGSLLARSLGTMLGKELGTSVGSEDGIPLDDTVEETVGLPLALALGPLVKLARSLGSMLG